MGRCCSALKGRQGARRIFPAKVTPNVILNGSGNSEDDCFRDHPPPQRTKRSSHCRHLHDRASTETHDIVPKGLGARRRPTM